MISVRSGLRILVTTSPVDFRRGMDSLAMLVTDTLRGNPFCGDLFVSAPSEAIESKSSLGMARVWFCIRSDLRQAASRGQRSRTA
jgi:hypothetical protein